ncbi:unnamed protein product, partial [Tetraodon nigroviridis]
MLQTGDGAVCFSAAFLLAVVLTRRAPPAALLAAVLYVFAAMFRFPPVPPDQAARSNGAAGPDGVPVLMHDETLDRTTNGSGPVYKMAFAQPRRLDAGLRHRMRDKYGGEKVPTPQEAVEECLRHRLTTVFDVKG